MALCPCRGENLNAPDKVLELSHKHFVPVSQKSQQASYTQATMKQAQQVHVGEFVWVMQSSVATAYTVKAVAVVSKPGLWAPYTRQGTIVVDGVIASVHSDWILDGLLERLGRPDLLPAIYQVSRGSALCLAIL